MSARFYKLVQENLRSHEQISQVQAKRMLKAMVNSVTTVVKEEGRCKIPGLGLLTLKQVPARIYRNPKTGAQVPKAETIRIRFKLSKDFKNSLLTTEPDEPNTENEGVDKKDGEEENETVSSNTVDDEVAKKRRGRPTKSKTVVSWKKEQ
eukprot:TRINITY_DN716_c0_g1_i2.p1 TRINITY_DN716_c0_g1~~TRINITY_DN716_c0_g1_i2.p1  ORF type:complete len:162 (-),score=26.90 TRINITY_DN716_c0_g1_i2:54-503(-)